MVQTATFLVGALLYALGGVAFLFAALMVKAAWGSFLKVQKDFQDEQRGQRDFLMAALNTTAFLAAKEASEPESQVLTPDDETVEID